MGLPAVLRLVRWPGTATAAADAAAGSLLFYCSPGRTAAAAAAGALLYAGGAALNDFADAGRDRRLHPGRPIPSGAVLRGEALLFGLLLLGGGVAAAIPGGRASTLAFAGVAAAVLLYDFLLKRLGPLGAVGMGLCRGGSVLAAALGSPSFEGLLEGAPARALLVPLPWFLMGLLVTGASLLEDAPRRRGLLPLATAGVLLPAALAFPLLAGARQEGLGLAIAAAALLAFALGRALAAAPRDDPRAAASAVVREGVFGFLLLDATVLGIRGAAVPAACAIGAWALLRALARGRS